MREVVNAILLRHALRLPLAASPFGLSTLVQEVLQAAEQRAAEVDKRVEQRGN
jgi:hypothetical protein